MLYRKYEANELAKLDAIQRVINCMKCYPFLKTRIKEMDNECLFDIRCHDGKQDRFYFDMQDVLEGSYIKSKEDMELIDKDDLRKCVSKCKQLYC